MFKLFVWVAMSRKIAFPIFFQFLTYIILVYIFLICDLHKILSVDIYDVAL